MNAILSIPLALLHHTYLLLTFRHTGKGLNSWHIFFALVVVSYAVGVTRWTVVPGSIQPLQVILFLSIMYCLLLQIIKPAVAAAAGYALISIAWDLIVIATSNVSDIPTANTVGHAEAIFLGVFLVKLQDSNV